MQIAGGRLLTAFLAAAALGNAQPAGESARTLFRSRCASCHGLDGAGGERGPSLIKRKRRTESELRDVIRNGVPGGGMPAFRLSAEQERALVAFIQSLDRQAGSRRGAGPAPRSVAVELRDGRTLRGVLRNESNYDLQLQDAAGAFHHLRRDQVVRIIDAKTAPPNRSAAPAGEPVEGDWPGYNGDPGGNRHSRLARINTANVGSLAPRWIFTIPGARRLEVTPVVSGGVMYVTAANECFALDALSGREIWHYRRPLTPGLAGDAAGAINRGVGLLDDRVFMVTDNAHLLALDRLTGTLVWDVEMADSRQNYGATSAPLVAGDLVISGTSGGDEGVRGFLSAYSAATGERVWRFWTVPAPGEPAAATWNGRAIEHGCATTWLTGTWDPAAKLLYWPTGNPCPDYNGDERGGDNLYSDSVLAIESATGKLRWHYQFTPHDLHDWDSTEPPVLVDAEFGGRRRPLLLQANRNGFFYVLDRSNGELLLAKPFVKKLTWASGVGKDGRPVLVPGSEPTAAGTRTCPSVEGATNWMSTAFNPDTGFFYVMALERCQMYLKSDAVWKAGESFYGGGTRDIPDDPGKKYLRAIDIRTGEIAWEYPQIGPANTWGGVLSTAGGLVFFGDDSGAFAAADARTGKPLWHFHTSQTWKASPMTYLAGGKQFVAVAAGPNILAFGL